MKKLSINLENCYGISKLEHSFDFSEKSAYVIYAPNGVMKTSFAKTFLDISRNEKPKDQIYSDLESKSIINDENDFGLKAEEIFVISSYENNYKSEKISTLLANSELKERYEQAHKEIDKAKKEFISGLSKLSGLKSNEIENQISLDLVMKKNDFFEAIGSIVNTVQNDDNPQAKFENVKYKIVFDEKVLELFEKNTIFKQHVNEYIEKYNELIENSHFFKKGVFNDRNASTIAKQLKSNGYFDAEHYITLKTKDTTKKVVVKSEAELERIIEQEKQSILTDEDLMFRFNEINDMISKNASLRSFQGFLEANPVFIDEFKNIGRLRRDLWVFYSKKEIDRFSELWAVYTSKRDEIKKIIEEASRDEEKSKWREVINIFNRRFSVPFKLLIDNVSDSVLGNETPNIKFIFEDNKGRKKVEEEELIRVLSRGELRALYLLNIIFEVEARKINNTETLFILDDIADSFDYKNKYAIIEYIGDMVVEENFNLIILTHNFDFYRTIASRLDLRGRKGVLHAEKTKDLIHLKEGHYLNNPFKIWKKELYDGAIDDSKYKFFLASIPFVRNIAEYVGNIDIEKRLTSVLHIKDDTKQLTVSDVEKDFVKILVIAEGLETLLPDKNQRVLDLIYSTASALSLEETESMELESKIVLAIAIRLKTEEYLIKMIDDNDFVAKINGYQTAKLIKEFKRKFPASDEEIKIIDRVCIMTPENIHVNSFMFEPILDMSNHHLQELYKEVVELK
ncbi:hypothetical protein [uncultured Alistipes sp.]|jgi:hypothetical protein|uniref:hypothetical protein n=1 Tax=uncultured Alistipes sp. TaxID=538949 RepID=UPI0025CD29C2|nr:hypothetical protein [uncultured Alistipes sp.]